MILLSLHIYKCNVLSYLKVVKKRVIKLTIQEKDRVKIDVKNSIKNSLLEVKEMQEGRVPEISWREMLEEVEKELESESR